MYAAISDIFIKLCNRNIWQTSCSITFLLVGHSVTAVLPPPGQRCAAVCLNSFGNRISPSDNSNDRWKRLCLVSWAVESCVWTLRRWLEIFLLTYLLTYSTRGHIANNQRLQRQMAANSLDVLPARPSQVRNPKITWVPLPQCHSLEDRPDTERVLKFMSQTYSLRDPRKINDKDSNFRLKKTLLYLLCYTAQIQIIP